MTQPYGYAATLISIVTFFLGALFTTQVSNALGGLRRVVIAGNFLLQGLLIVLGAILTATSVIATEQEDSMEERFAVFADPAILIGFAPLAFQSGATIASSRILGYGGEIPVTVLTSTYAALASDPNLFKLRGNKPRNRRMAAVLCLFIGAICATWIQVESIGMVACLWFGAGVKLVIAAMIFLFMKGQKVAEAENV
ncbi:MAG: hypothetical protein M1831_002797 [Alyxoria varia]|nr:MAG: hypothetical protein M1831_002797 [Alyxoria varia]